MNRCRIGAGLLVLLLIFGLISALSMARFGAEMAETVLQAAQLRDTDRDASQALLEEAEGIWQRKRFCLGILSDHKPIREADILFALLKNPSESDSFRENALRLALVLRDLGQAQLPRWENVL